MLACLPEGGLVGGGIKDMEPLRLIPVSAIFRAGGNSIVRGRKCRSEIE